MSKAAEKRTGVVIVAAGRGARMGDDDGPKQYRDLGGRSILERVVDINIETPLINVIQVVINADDRDIYAGAISFNAKLQPPVVGGATRQLSVLAGLEALPQDLDIVLIHDAARPFADKALIERVVRAVEPGMGALPSLPVVDTLKRSDNNGLVEKTIPRERLHHAQTPQGFDYRTILAAHRKANTVGRTDFTDDSALAEWAGIPVSLVEGAVENTKITTAADLEKARRFMSLEMPDVRVGHGYDTHQWGDGNSVWLCGVEIPHTHTLLGHSDADVGLHALTDALLSTVAAGDIGSHFPPTDAQWKNASSDRFLRHAVELVEQNCGTITHLDITLICETPKIGPHRDAMRNTIHDITGVGVDKISIKATTNEKIGFIGRSEGMAALATATVVVK